MIIDMHSHYYGGLIDALTRRTSRPSVTTDQAGQPVLNAMTASTVMGQLRVLLRERLMDTGSVTSTLDFLDRATERTEVVE